MTKPDIFTASQNLINAIRAVFPFDMPEAQLCAGVCIGCPKKLLAFMDSELEYLQSRINQQEKINLGDLQTLERQAKKIKKVLQKNQLIA